MLQHEKPLGTEPPDPAWHPLPGRRFVRCPPLASWGFYLCPKDGKQLEAVPREDRGEGLASLPLILMFSFSPVRPGESVDPSPWLGILPVCVGFLTNCSF